MSGRASAAAFGLVLLLAAAYVCQASHGAADPATVEAFEAWFKENGGSAHKVKVASVPGAGYGLVATAPIEPGEVVIEVPASLFLTCEGHPVAKWMPENTPDLKQWCIAVRLVTEHNDPASKFGPFLRLLPKEVGQLWDFDSEEIEQLFSPYAVEAMRIRNATLHYVYENVILPLTQKMPAHYPADKYSLELLRWSASIAFSRSWLTYGMMVPMVDMANHDGTKGDPLRVDTAAPPASPEEKVRELRADELWVRGTLRAIVAYQPGDQVFTTYGSDKSMADFLLNFGFLPPYEDSVGVLRLSIERKPDSSPSTLAGIAAMAERGLGVPTDSGGRQLLVYVRESTVPKAMLEFLRLASYQGPPEQVPPPGYISLENERRALQGLRQQLVALLERAPNSVEADEAEVARLEGEVARATPGDPAAAKLRRRALVVRARMHETKIRKTIIELSEALWVRMMIAENPADVTR